jgi:predicted nucleic acid-binding Zn ribbon protein
MKKIARVREVTLKDAIQQLLRLYKLEDKLLEHKLIANWEKVVGTMISRHTREIWIKDNKLFVKLDSSAIRMELSYNRTQLVDMLNESIGQELIKEVVLR